MKQRICLLYIFILLSIALNAQVLTNFNASINVFMVRGTAPDYSISGLVNNTSGQYTSANVQAGDILYMSHASSCVRFEVLTVIQVGSSITATVRDIDGITSAFPLGIGMICRETANFSFPLYVDGISDDLLACVRTHFTELVDQITVTGVPGADTDSIYFDSAGVITLATRGDTVILPIGGAGGIDTDEQNLSRSGDSVLIENGTGVDLSDLRDNTDTSGYNLFLVRSNDTLYISDGNGTLFAVLPADQVFDGDSSITNEIQELTKSNDTIYLSGGGFVLDTDTDTNTDSDTLYFKFGNTILQKVRNDTVNIPVAIDTTFASNDTIFFVSNGDTSIVILDVPGDNWGSQVVVSDATLTGNGTVANPLSVVFPADEVFDGDSSTTNELQDIQLTTISTGLPYETVTYQLYLTNSSEIVEVNDNVQDADPDPTNEIQQIDSAVLTGTTLIIYLQSGGSASVDLASIDTDTDTDEQNLSLVGDSLLIERGAGVDLSSINTDTSGYNLTFEKVGDSLFITDGAGTLSVYIPDSVGGFVLPTDSITFNNNEAGPDEAELNWDQTIGFPVFGGLGGISIKLGQDALWLCENQTGTQINKGTVVGVVGALGNSGKFLIAPFLADGNTDNDLLLGIAAEDIPNGTDGYVMHQGKIRQINLTAYPQGSILYASPTVAGALTTTEPANGFQKFPIAFVVDSSANGTLGVRVKTGEALRDLHDVDVSTPADRDLIAYDSALGYWVTVKDSIYDGDSSVTNELQTLSWSAGTNGQDEITLSDGGGTITITDDWGSQVVYTDEDVDGTGTLTGDGTAASPLKLAQQGATSGEVLKWSNTSQTWLPSTDQINDADAVPTNELQDLGLAANILSLTLSGSTVDLSGYLDNTDSQQLSWDEPTRTLSLDNSGSVVIGDAVNDSDADPSNEIQTITWSDGGSGSDIITLSNGGGAVTIADSWGSQSVYSDNTLSGSGVPPSDPLKIAQQGATNGQALKWDGSTWSPSDDNYANWTIEDQVANSELVGNQTIKFEGDGSVSTNYVPSTNTMIITGIDNVNDADSDPNNELQDLALASDILSLTLSSTTVDLSPYLDNTDDQIIDVFGLVGTGLNLSLENDKQATQVVDLSPLQDGNGVYDGSGTIPASTLTTITGGEWNLKSDASSSITMLNLIQPESGTLDRSAINLFKDAAAVNGIIFYSDPVSDYAEIYFDGNEDFNINAHVGDLKFQNGTFTHLQVNQDGTIDLPDYGTGAITGTAAYYLAVDASGNLIESTPATGTDDQNLTAATLTGTSLQIDIENGTSATVDLASLQDGTGTDDQNLTGATLTGTSLQIDIESGSSTSVDLAALQDVYTGSEGISEASNDFKLGEANASATAFVTADRYLNFGSSTTNSLILNSETSATSGTFAPLTIRSITASNQATSAIKFVAGTGTYNTGYIKWTEPILDEQGFLFEGGYVRLGSFVTTTSATETILTTRDPNNEIAKVNVNQIGVPLSTYTATQAGFINIDFAGDGRHIAEVNCSSVTSAFTANVQNEGTMTTAFAAIYNIRFHSVGASDITVTLDAADTWYNEKGDVITTLTLTANEDKIFTFYTSDGVNFYTME